MFYILILWLFAQVAGPNKGNAEVATLDGKVVGAANVGQMFTKDIYFCGRLEGEYGFYRTFDEGKSYERLNQDNQMYGEINSIDGDKRKFGRFFLATGSRGVLYGEMKRQSRKI